MGAMDKAVALLNGKRLIDHVTARARDQAAQLLLAAPHDYETGLPFVPDQPGLPAGPVGAIATLAACVAREHGRDARFVTVPVDAPFFPRDLVRRLMAVPGCGFVETPAGMQPVFAIWAAGMVLDALAGADAEADAHWPIRRLAGLCDAQAVRFDRDDAFANINTPEQLAEAASRLAADDYGS